MTEQITLALQRAATFREPNGLYCGVSGNPADFQDYVREISPRLVRLAYLLTGSATDAEDLVQESLLRVHLKWGSIAPLDRRDAYVLTVLVNTDRRWHRKRRVKESRTGDTHDRAVGDLGLIRVEDRLDLARRLRPLTTRQRAVVILRFCEDHSEREIAEMLGCHVGTVKSQTAKALAKLRNQGWGAQRDHERMLT